MTTAGRHPAPDRLSALWAAWRPSARRLAVTVRPALLPHLRAVDRDQVDDLPATLALSGFRVTPSAVTAALAAGGTRAHAEGWPGPVPTPIADPAGARRGVDAAALAALDGWVAALTGSRLATLAMLQGTPPADVLPTAAPALREALVGPAIAAGLVPAMRAEGPRRHSLPGAPDPEEIAACLARLWECAEREPAWDVRAALLHLGVLWIRPWPGANGRAARLLLNTLRAAAGHRWLVIPPARAGVYTAAVEAARDAGDAEPFCRLVHACSARSSRPPA
jgi:hypothetical protein